ncbi:MAG TPA: hypothetical protein VJB87_00795 [Candidatus Nanoarchaeia archaeon]|nr:hypothetical protein [Candidatus Nanoarchaeia archaeon]
MLERYVTMWKSRYQKPVTHISRLCAMPFYVPTAWRLTEPWLRRDAEDIACTIAPDMIRVPRRLMSLTGIALTEGVLAYAGACQIGVGGAFPWILAATNMVSGIAERRRVMRKRNCRL